MVRLKKKSLLYRHKHRPTTPVYLYVLCKYAYDSCKSMTGQRKAAVWPLTAFLYFDSTAVYVHIVLTILHRSTKESYNSHLIILILIQNFIFIHKNLIWIINIGFGIGKSVILRYLYDPLVLLLLTYTEHDCALRCSDWEVCLVLYVSFD